MKEFLGQRTRDLLRVADQAAQVAMERNEDPDTRSAVARSCVQHSNCVGCDSSRKYKVNYFRDVIEIGGAGFEFVRERIVIGTKINEAVEGQLLFSRGVKSISLQRSARGWAAILSTQFNAKFLYISLKEEVG